MQYLVSVIDDQSSSGTADEMAARFGDLDVAGEATAEAFATAVDRRPADGPEVALAAGDRLQGALAGYHAYHATRADLPRRLGCSQQSRAAYDKAIELAGNTAETAYLTRPRDQPG